MFCVVSHPGMDSQCVERAGKT